MRRLQWMCQTSAWLRQLVCVVLHLRLNFTVLVSKIGLLMCLTCFTTTQCHICYKLYHFTEMQHDRMIQVSQICLSYPSHNKYKIKLSKFI